MAQDGQEKATVGAAGLPVDFDPTAYLQLNPDVAAANLDPAEHWREHGAAEGRGYHQRDPDVSSRAAAFWTDVHPSPSQASPLHLASHPAEIQPSSRRVCERLLDAYRHSVRSRKDHQKNATTDLWTPILQSGLRALADALDSGDVNGVLQFMLDFGREYTWFGGITTGIDGYSSRDLNSQAVAHAYFDKLVCLAEAVGALPVDNPEQGRGADWALNMTRPVDEVVQRIQERTGISITPPLGIVPIHGLLTAAGPIHYRHINAVYTALRVAALTEDGDAVCEYGGGLGLVPIYLTRHGSRRYVLFDLPLVNVLSGYVLAIALGEDAVTFEGEDGDGPVFITAGWNCQQPPIGEFALSLNQDSFPEIDPAIVSDYMTAIHHTTVGHLLSINHESSHHTAGNAQHVPVPTTLDNDSRFTRMYRMPYWLRRGYVEELYATRTA